MEDAYYLYDLMKGKDKVTLAWNNACAPNVGAHSQSTKDVHDHKAGHAEADKTTIDSLNVDSNDKFLNVALSSKNKIDLDNEVPKCELFSR